MKEYVLRFLREEDGDVVQNVIIIAIFAALALAFGKTIVEFVQNLMGKIVNTGKDANSAVDNAGMTE